MGPKTAILLSLLGAGLGVAPLAHGLQVNPEQRAERQAESEAPQSVSGGATFQRNVPAERAYDDLLNWAKREGLVLASASRETGQIVTEIQVTGGYRQTGTRVYLTTIKDGDATTTIRVAVSEQKRYKALTTEAWGTPKVNAERSRDLAQRIQAAVR
jgi:hypothetical protein